MWGFGKQRLWVIWLWTEEIRMRKPGAKMWRVRRGTEGQARPISESREKTLRTVASGWSILPLGFHVSHPNLMQT